MTLGSDINAAIPELRAQANSRMTETIEAGQFRDHVDPDTLATTRVAVGPPIYSGKAQVKYPTLVVSKRDAASTPAVVQDIVVKLPVGSPRLPEGTEIVVRASDVDALLVDRVYRVKGSPQAGQVTAHRYPVTELS